MNTTPLWVPLVVAVLTFIGTLGGALGGVVITQRSADKRERDNRADEFKLERERWAREDEARTFEQRRDAYIEFYESLGQTLGAVNYFFHEGADLSRLPLREGWDMPLLYHLWKVEIYGSESIVALAQRAYEIVGVWGGSLHRSPDHLDRVIHDEDLSYEADTSPRRFIDAVRKELRVPEGQRVEPNSQG